MTCLKSIFFLKSWAPTLDIVSSDPYAVDHIYPQRVDEEPEVNIVALADTIWDEWTMVVKHLDAYVAWATVDWALRSNYHAGGTEFEPWHEGFLAVKSINDQIVFKLHVPFDCVLIVCLLWNHASIGSRSKIQKSVDDNPHDYSENKRKVIAIVSFGIVLNDLKDKIRNYFWL